MEDVLGGGASLVEHLGVPASLHDVDGYYVHVNPAGQRAAGHPASFFRGLTFHHFLTGDDLALVDGHFRRVVQTGEPAEFETSFIDASGERRWTRAMHLPVSDGDQIVGVLILAFAGVAPTVHTRPDLPAPTRRQLEVLELIARGFSTNEIAAALSLSRETVRNHVRNALSALDAHTRQEAVAAAKRYGLLSPAPLEPRS